MGEERKPKQGMEDIALKVLLGDTVCEAIDAENEEERDIEAAEERNIFDNKEKIFNFSKRRATDLKGNSRVFFPRQARSLEDEARLETMRMQLRTTFKCYVDKSCQEGGKQITNIPGNLARGLKSLRKRVTEGELVILPTDKSGRLAVMTRDTYKEAGLKHTLRDKEVSWADIKESQKELNGHVSMMVKIFKIGGYWGHSQRGRETTMGEGLSICPMSLLFKDHKGWEPSSGSVPPTRPVVGGHLGINMHLSELVSDILDPVVNNYDGGHEVISTEDMLAETEIMNCNNEGWHELSYWGGMVMGEYEACQVCSGQGPLMRMDEEPELCNCEDMDGISDEGRVLVTMGAMKRLKRLQWELEVGWDEKNTTMEYTGNEVCHEDLQDQCVPMVLIGTDVVNLYPSLDITRVVEDVQQAILDSKITWREIDYLEAARYVALNWPETKCRSSGLWRVLPRRRKATGTRPGLKGIGPQGGMRGHQEQWVFPRVRLRPQEKKLLIATVASGQVGHSGHV